MRSAFPLYRYIPFAVFPMLNVGNIRNGYENKINRLETRRHCGVHQRRGTAWDKCRPLALLRNPKSLGSGVTRAGKESPRSTSFHNSKARDPGLARAANESTLSTPSTNREAWEAGIRLAAAELKKEQLLRGTDHHVNISGRKSSSEFSPGYEPLLTLKFPGIPATKTFEKDYAKTYFGTEDSKYASLTLDEIAEKKIQESKTTGAQSLINVATKTSTPKRTDSLNEQAAVSAYLQNGIKTAAAMKVHRYSSNSENGMTIEPKKYDYAVGNSMYDPIVQLDISTFEKLGMATDEDPTSNPVEVDNKAKSGKSGTTSKSLVKFKEMANSNRATVEQKILSLRAKKTIMEASTNRFYLFRNPTFLTSVTKLTPANDDNPTSSLVEIEEGATYDSKKIAQKSEMKSKLLNSIKNRNVKQLPTLEEQPTNLDDEGSNFNEKKRRSQLLLESREGVFYSQDSSYENAPRRVFFEVECITKGYCKHRTSNKNWHPFYFFNPKTRFGVPSTNDNVPEGMINMGAYSIRLSNPLHKHVYYGSDTYALLRKTTDDERETDDTKDIPTLESQLSESSDSSYTAKPAIRTFSVKTNRNYHDNYYSEEEVFITQYSLRLFVEKTVEIKFVQCNRDIAILVLSEDEDPKSLGQQDFKIEIDEILPDVIGTDGRTFYGNESTCAKPKGKNGVVEYNVDWLPESFCLRPFFSSPLRTVYPLEIATTVPMLRISMITNVQVCCNRPSEKIKHTTYTPEDRKSSIENPLVAELKSGITFTTKDSKQYRLTTAPEHNADSKIKQFTIPEGIINDNLVRIIFVVNGSKGQYLINNFGDRISQPATQYSETFKKQGGK